MMKFAFAGAILLALSQRRMPDLGFSMAPARIVSESLQTGA